MHSRIRRTLLPSKKLNSAFLSAGFSPFFFCAKMSSSVFDIRPHVVPCQHIREYPAATSEDQEADLQLHVKQYTPRDESATQSGAITIIGAHANGFPKVCI